MIYDWIYKLMALARNGQIVFQDEPRMKKRRMKVRNKKDKPDKPKPKPVKIVGY